jgi:hypothetical protein
MLSFIKEVDDSTKFQIEVFDGKVVLQCRILSPIEAEAAGMSTSLVASSMMDTAQISRIMRQKDKLKNIDFNDPNDDDLELIFNMMDGFKPEQLLSIEEQQNKILMQVVKRASEDGGNTFQDIKLVSGIDQQSPENNRLWVGMLTNE